MEPTETREPSESTHTTLLAAPPTLNMLPDHLANDAEPLTSFAMEKLNKRANAETTYLDIVKRAVAICSKSLEDGKKRLEKAQKKGKLPATQTKISKVIEASERALDYWSRELAAVEPFFK